MKEQINLIILTKLYFLNVHAIAFYLFKYTKCTKEQFRTLKLKSILQFINTCNSIYI